MDMSDGTRAETSAFNGLTFAVPLPLLIQLYTAYRWFSKAETCS